METRNHVGMVNNSTTITARDVVFRFITLAITIPFLSGCWRPAYIDVTQSPKYNFSSFTNTVWRTKTQVALIDVKRYTGRHELALVPPSSFDTADPKFRPVPYGKTIAIFPAGTHLQIERLMKDNGNWGGLEVTVRVENEEYSRKTVFVDRGLLAKNLFIWEGESSSTNWGVDRDFLEETAGSSSSPVKK